MELLVLQLLVLGYTPRQIAPLVNLDQREIGRIAQEVATRFGATEWRAAAMALVRRGVLSGSKLPLAAAS